jgi:hypothetical protein
MSMYYVVKVDSDGYVIDEVSRHSVLYTAEVAADMLNSELPDDSDYSYAVYDDVDYI